MKLSTRLASLVAIFIATTIGSTASAADQCDTALGQQAFGMCSACHALSAGAPQREGPHLQNIFGRRAASLSGFNYSPALQQTQWLWNAELLDRWLANPRRVLPGTTMTFVGLKSPAERAALICYLQGAAQVAQVPDTAENPGPNRSIVRSVSGTYAYRTLQGARRRGEEHFQLFVYPDGSRSMLVWNDLFARDAQFNVTLRVAADYRPIEAFVSYWNAAQFKGSALFRVQGSSITTQSSGPAGAINQTLEVPQKFSIGSHPVAADGWHAAFFDAGGPPLQSINLYSVEASTDLTKPVLGSLVSMQLERIGRETIQVPAGTFVTTHYRLAGGNDLWVLDQDLLVVRSSVPGRDRDYVLTALRYSGR